MDDDTCSWRKPLWTKAASAERSRDVERLIGRDVFLARDEEGAAFGWSRTPDSS
jgi:hypothetical protein